MKTLEEMIAMSDAKKKLEVDDQRRRLVDDFNRIRNRCRKYPELWDDYRSIVANIARIIDNVLDE